MREVNSQPANTYMTPHPAFHAQPLDKHYSIIHGRNKKESHEKRYRQINNHHSCEVLQVQADFLIQKEDNNQSPHCGQGSRQYGHKSFQITPVQNVVRHHNGTVYHKIQGHSNPCQ